MNCCIFLKRDIVLVLFLSFAVLVKPFGQDREDKKELNFLFLGSSWMASAIGQHHIVPNLLEQKGYKVNTGFCFGPGQNFEGHIKNNMGLPTQMQTDFVKQARAEKWFTEEKCQWFEDVPMSKKGTLDSAFSKMKYDLAFMHVSGSDTGPHAKKDFYKYGSQLIDLARENNPDIVIVVIAAWSKTKDYVEILNVLWTVEKFALTYDCLVAPVGLSFLKSYEAMPDVSLHRSLKDSHQNNVSSFLSDSASLHFLMTIISDSRIEHNYPVR